MFSLANSWPGRTAMSRAAGSVPNREPQNTQREDGAETDTDTALLQAIRCLSGPGRHGIILATQVATPMGAGGRTAGRLMSRTVIWLVGAGAIVIAAALGVAWYGKLTDQAGLDRANKPAAPTAAAAPTVPSAPAPAPAAGSGVIPSFDVARIGQDGRAVIAGRAAPGAKIVLIDGGKEIAEGQADARGEWLIIAQDPPLASGQHELRVVQHIEGRAPVTSEQVVIAVVPEPPKEPSAPREETLVMISPPGGAATLVQPPSAAGVPKSGDLALSTLDYDENGRVTVTGLAAPGSVVRVYGDDKPPVEGPAGAGGHWKLAAG